MREEQYGRIGIKISFDEMGVFLGGLGCPLLVEQLQLVLGCLQLVQSLSGFDFKLVDRLSEFSLLLVSLLGLLGVVFLDAVERVLVEA